MAYPQAAVVRVLSMNGCWLDKSSSGERKNDDETTAAAVSEEDIVELCKLEIEEIKEMMRPETTRIFEAFDFMMSKVKV